MGGINYQYQEWKVTAVQTLKRVTRVYHEQLYTNKFNNLDKINNSLKDKLPKSTQEKNR